MDEHECSTCNKKFYLDETDTPDECPQCESNNYEWKKGKYNEQK